MDGPIPMNMDTAPMTMPTDAHLLTLTQWLSPAYPLGSFAYSHGLESAVAEGWVKDAEGVHDWLEDLLTEGSGRMDAHWITQAHSAPVNDALADINAEARAFTPAYERLRETERQGTAFARVTAEVWGLDIPESVFPVALGRAAGLMGIDCIAVKTLYLQSFVSNLVAVSQRLLPLGQTGAQAILARLSLVCQTVALDDSPFYSNAFLSDIAAMSHETQTHRLFQS